MKNLFRKTFLIFVPMKLFIPFVLATIIFNISCKLENTKLLERDKQINFGLKFSPRQTWSGVYTKQNLKYFYFSDVVTFKEILFFNEFFEPVKKISLKEILKNDNIAGLTPLSLDSILVLSEYTNNLYLINQEGHILNKTALSSYLNTPYELNRSVSGGLIVDNNTVWLSNDPVQDSTFDRKDAISSMKKTWNNASNRPFLTKIENPLGQIKLVQCLDKFYSNFSKDDYFYIEGNNYMIAKNYILLLSYYSDTLYIANKNNVKIERKMPIKSKLTDLPCQPILINQENLSKELHNIHLQTFGSVENICFDEFRNIYYLSLMHKVPINTTKENRGANRSWSIQVLNDKFELIDEVKMNAKEFMPGYIIPIKEGILISNMSKDNSDETVGKFTLFKVNL